MVKEPSLQKTKLKACMSYKTKLMLWTALKPVQSCRGHATPITLYESVEPRVFRPATTPSNWVHESVRPRQQFSLDSPLAMDQQNQAYMSYKTNVLIILNVYIVFRAWFPDSAIKRAIVIRGFKFLAFLFFLKKWLGSQNEFRMILFGIGIQFFVISPQKNIFPNFT